MNHAIDDEVEAMEEAWESLQVRSAASYAAMDPDIRIALAEDYVPTAMAASYVDPVEALTM